MKIMSHVLVKKCQLTSVIIHAGEIPALSAKSCLLEVFTPIIDKVVD
jgi:hypothetical protein